MLFFSQFDKYIICEDGFCNYDVGGKIRGFKLKIRLTTYRSVPLSCIEKVQVKIDGTDIPESDIILCLNGKRFSLEQLTDMYAEWWYFLDKAELEIRKDGGLSKGAHNVEVTLIRRSTYIYVHGGYMKFPGFDKKTIEMTC